LLPFHFGGDEDFVRPREETMRHRVSKAARRSSAALTTLFAVAAAFATGTSATAAGLPTTAAQTFRVYCASCHGTGGEGDGPVAPTLIQKPADLTRIAERNDGVFPKERVSAVIDGREEVAAHGPREMPVWGDALIWPEEDTPGRRAEVKRRIDELVAFVEGMQKKPAPSKP
jgi:mono/diheme cytochrome c family protein